MLRDIKSITGTVLAGLIVFMLFVFVAQARAQTNEGQLVVYGSGPYEVWGGFERAPDGPSDYNHYAYYYNIDLQEGYVKLGEGSDIAVFPGGYKFYVVATHSMFHLDAIQLPHGNYIQGESFAPGEYVTWGNVHLPWQFNDPPLYPCDLIGNISDYTHDDYIYGPPDGIIDDVGHTPDCGTTLERYEGFVVVESPSDVNLFVAIPGINASSLTMPNMVRYDSECEVIISEVNGLSTQQIL